MPEALDSIKQANENEYEPEDIHQTLLRLRTLVSELPPVDAAAVVRDTREAVSRAN